MKTTPHPHAPHIPTQRTPHHDGVYEHRTPLRRHPFLLTVITNTGHLEYVTFLLNSYDAVEAWCLNHHAGTLDRRRLLHWLTGPAPQTELTDTQFVFACDAGTGITLTLPGITRHRITRPERDRLLSWLRTDIP